MEELKLKSKTLNILKVDEITPLKGMLIYGLSGSGKTFFCASVAEVFSKVLHLDFEYGASSIRSACSLFGIDKERIEIVQIDSPSALSEVLEALRNNQTYQAITIDNFSLVEHFIETEAYDLGVQIARDFDKRKHIPEVLERRDWGIVLRKGILLLLEIRNLCPSIHVIVTAQASEGEDPADTKKTLWQPTLRGQLKSMAPQFFDIVGYLKQTSEEEEEKKEKGFKNRLYFRSTGSFLAKSRFPDLGAYMNEPTFKKIWEKIK